MSPRIRKAAVRWLVRLQADDVSPDDRAQFACWLAADKSHGEIFNIVAGRIEAFYGLGPRIGAHYDRKLRARRARRRALMGAGGAVACASLTGFGLYWRAAHAQAYFVTAIGQQRDIALDDGSYVALNTNTRIGVRMNKERRFVAMDCGEAMFTVAHDGERPFEVEAGRRIIRALGTAFVVRSDDGNLRLMVTQGVVQVRPSGHAGGETVLVAGDSFLGRRGRAGIVRTLSGAELDRALAWRSGMLMFNGESLSEAVKEVARYNRVRLEIIDPELEELPIVGYFRIANLEGFLSQLERDFPSLEVVRGDGCIRLERRREDP